MKFIIGFFCAILVTAFSVNSKAEIKYYRWTNDSSGVSDNLQGILAKLNTQAGLKLTNDNFITFEHRDMANYRFTTFLQTFNGVPVKGAMIRTWADLQTGNLSQMEAHLEDAATTTLRIQKLQSQKFSISRAVSSLNTMNFVKQVVLKNKDDKTIGEVKTSDQWDGMDLQRVIRVRGSHGMHVITVSYLTKSIVSQTYEPYPNADLNALVYPIYEETEYTHVMQKRVPVTLKNILAVRKQVTADPYAVLRARKYLESKIDPVLGNTVEGQTQGFWSFTWIMDLSRSLYEALPWEANTFANGGMYLEGQYATVSLHPNINQWKGIQLPFNYSGHIKFLENDVVADGQADTEMIPTAAYRGQLLADVNSALNRVARRLPDHDPVSYINDGFDEIQVYYAVDQLMQSMHNMGFTDPELSTRAFNAFLYDPDISMRDNAYYTNDTINFTTYSPTNQNFARDNSTIWHELGHGVMDRLMGDLITLADTGGLSEGMADFCAKLVVEDVTNGQPFDGENDFRIINHTGFNLTNEVHDDGEAYGGTMADILKASIAKYGRPGLRKMADLTLDTMRLTRNHPGLTANDWFEHMLFADQLGHAGVRAPGDMASLISSALQSRNFRLDRGEVASYKILVNGKDELNATSAGSRNRPIPLTLNGAATASYQLTLSLKSAAGYAFRYPVKVEANYAGGPLEGAVKWDGKEKGPQVFTLKDESQSVTLNLGVHAGCDFVNRPDGSCSDYTYIKIYNAGDKTPVAKKRFYVRVKSGS